MPAKAKELDTNLVYATILVFSQVKTLCSTPDVDYLRLNLLVFSYQLSAISYHVKCKIEIKKHHSINF